MRKSHVREPAVLKPACFQVMVLHCVTHPLQLCWLQGTIKELESKLQKKTPSAEKAPASMEAADKGERQLSAIGADLGVTLSRRRLGYIPSLGQLLLQPACRPDCCLMCMSTCLCVGRLSDCHLIECSTPCLGGAHAGECARGSYLPASDGHVLCSGCLLSVQMVGVARRTQLLLAAQRGSRAPAALRSVEELSQKTSQTALHPARATSERGRAAECLQGLKKPPLSPNTILQGIQTCSQNFCPGCCCTGPGLATVTRWN